jgi:hypothetical protein
MSKRKYYGQEEETEKHDKKRRAPILEILLRLGIDGLQLSVKVGRGFWEMFIRVWQRFRKILGGAFFS